MDYQTYVNESLATITRSIRKDSRSVKNRIWSIYSDSEFVQQVSKAYGSLPLVANERCGRWYIPPDQISQSVYFKSTDGHCDQWSFSIRRLNTHILSMIESNCGVVIVDSTRRGKRMPDALSKTIPIWCAVINKVLFDQDMFYTPPNAVSRSEHSQIESLIPQFVEQLKSIDISIRIDKPLRPIWVTPDALLPEEKPHFEEFHPVILCTASRMVQDGTEHREGFTYVQGAADDHEEWARLLTPELLWGKSSSFRSASTDEELYQIIEEAAAASVGGSEDVYAFQGREMESLTQIEPHAIWIGRVIDTDQKFDILIDLRDGNSSDEPTSAVFSDMRIIKMPLKSGKQGSKQFRLAISQIITQLSVITKEEKEEENRNVKAPRVAIVCDTGSDFSVGTALAIICKRSNIANKQGIRKELAHIITQHKSNPSRATLNAVNSYLMG